MYPVLGHFHGVTFYTYGTVLLLALILIYVLANRYRDPTLLQRGEIDDLGLVVLIAIWIGGGVVLLPFAAPFDLTHLAELFRSGKWRQAGTVAISVAVMLLLSLYCWRQQLPFVRVLDFLMPLFILGYAMQRTLGCFSAGCCYGQPSELFWAVRFPDTAGVGPPAGVPVHPTQLYLGITAWLTYRLLRRWEIRQPPDGTTTCLGIIGLFGSYFAIAFVRGDLAASRHLWSMPVSQLLAGVLCVGGILALLFLWRAAKTNGLG